MASIKLQDTSFCVEALEEAIDRYGCPNIFNTDQGSQFTSGVFTSKLKDDGIRISMDGKGRWVYEQQTGCVINLVSTVADRPFGESS